MFNISYKNISKISNNTQFMFTYHFCAEMSFKSSIQKQKQGNEDVQWVLDDIIHIDKNNFEQEMKEKIDEIVGSKNSKKIMV